MLNFFIILAGTLFLTYNNILLLNEESLILLCFITFTFICFTKFGKSLTEYLSENSIKGKLILQSSLKQLLLKFKQLLIFKKKTENLVEKFKYLGNYYYAISLLLGKTLPNKNMHNLTVIYKNRLNYISKVEKQTLKILAFLIIKKLTTIVTLKKFYSSTLKVKYFKAINSIIVREYLKIIKLK